MYQAKFVKYSTGETVFIKDLQREQIISRKVYGINKKRCVIYKKNIYRLAKKIKNTMRSPEYYQIIFYRRFDDVK